MKKVFAAILIVCAFQSAAQVPSFISDSLDSYIQRGMQQWQIPGLAIAIVKDGKVLVQKGYGIRHMDQKDRVDENTLFIIASNSKLFTGTALANLDHQKKISLNDKVTQYIPWFQMYDSATTRMATVRDMVTHRLGTKTFQGDFTFWGSNLPKDSIIWKMRHLKPVGLFRQDYGYCNSGYVVAGEIIRKATGQTWERYIEQHMLTPLGMNNTYMNTAGLAKHLNVATPHTNGFSGLTIIPFDSIDNLGPATSMVSNVKDLSHWLLMQLDSGRYAGKQVLPWEVVQKTRDAVAIISNRKNNFYPSHYRTYGLGVYSADYNGKQVFWHTGGAFGYVTNVCFVPEAKLGITILTNNDNQSFFEALRYQVLDAFLGVPYTDRSRFMMGFAETNRARQNAEIKNMNDRVIKNNSMPVKAEDYTGDYYNTVYGKITVSKNDQNRLTVRFQHHPQLSANLDYMDGNEFRATYKPISYGIFPVKFVMKNGRPNGVEIKTSDFIEYDAYLFERDTEGLMVK